MAGGASSTLNATSGGRAATSVAPAVGCSSRRAVVGREAGERVRRAQARARAPARECAVEIHGKAEIAPEPVRQQQRLRDRRAALGVAAMDDRGDVEHPDARVHARVRGQVDALDRLARALQQREVQRARLAREREHRAMVVGVRVDVEQARAAGDERGADRVERRGVAALGDVGDREQQRLTHRGGRDDPPRRRLVLAERERPALREGRGALLGAVQDGGGVAVLEVAAAGDGSPRP